MLLYIGILELWEVYFLRVHIYCELKTLCLLLKLLSSSLSCTDSGSSSGAESDADKDSVALNVQKVWILLPDFIGYLVLLFDYYYNE